MEPFRIKKAVFVTSVNEKGGYPPPRPEIALVGRSNVGKSSLINCLAGNGKLARISAAPGKTRLINYYLVNDSFYLVDLPGYGFAKMPAKAREELKAVVRDYIHNSAELACLFVLVDSRFDIPQIDRDFIAELGENGVPFAIIFTKCDKKGPNAVAAQMERDRQILLQDWESLPPMFASSSLKGSGRDEILDYIGTILNNL